MRWWTAWKQGPKKSAEGARLLTPSRPPSEPRRPFERCDICGEPDVARALALDLNMCIRPQLLMGECSACRAWAKQIFDVFEKARFVDAVARRVKQLR